MLVRSLLVFLSVAFLSAPAWSDKNKSTEVPFGDKVSNRIYNYHRHTPRLATAGRIHPKGFIELRRLGFNTIIDLRTEQEGVASEKKEVESLGLDYYTIPVGDGLPTRDELASFRALLDEKARYPVLVHCGSGDRVGAMWSLLRLDQGVELEQAILEGKTIGMKTGRENLIRKSLEK